MKSDNKIKKSLLMRKIRADIKRKKSIFIADGANTNNIKILLSDGTLANVLYRSMRFCANGPLMPFAYIFQYLNKLLNGCVIGLHAEFDEGFVLMHPVGVIINSKVRGGKNITLESSVVIGDEKGHSPILANNIFVGSGAKIIGHVKIEENVKIGANAVVVKSAPANSTMLGIPAKPITKELE